MIRASVIGQVLSLKLRVFHYNLPVQLGGRLHSETKFGTQLLALAQMVGLLTKPPLPGVSRPVLKIHAAFAVVWSLTEQVSSLPSGSRA